ncbi:MAG: division/cell wall cluster transcriptional repressor MraZ [Dehalococcoidia bacterium]
MFYGKQEYTVDERGRVPVPSDFRAVIADSPVWLVQGADDCLELYPDREFERFRQEIEHFPRLSQDGRRIRRAFFSSAQKLNLDKQNRILIPAEIRDERGITGTVIFSGRGDVLELWTKAAWEQEQAKFRAEYNDMLERTLEKSQ